MQRSSSSGERAAAAAGGTAGGQAAGGKRVTNAMIEVALSTDFGVNDNTHIALSHLVRYARQAAALLLLLPPPPPPPPLLLSYWLGLLLSFWLGLLLSGLAGWGLVCAGDLRSARAEVGPLPTGGREGVAVKGDPKGILRESFGNPQEIFRGS